MGFESAAYCVHEKVIRVRVQLFRVQSSSPPTCSVWYTSHQVSNCGALSFQVQAFRGYGL